jgi:tetratricopeptide (TPR) repeat protein
MSRWFCVCLGLLVPAAAGAGEPLRVLWLPARALELGPERAARADALLAAALEAEGGLELVSVEALLARPEAFPPEVGTELARAVKARARGREQLLEMQLDEAVEAFQTARVSYRKLGAYLDDLDPLIDALMGLGEAFASQGDLEAARAAYREILVLSPDYLPDPSEVPTRFRTLFEEERQEARQQLGGRVRVRVEPGGARVVLDGLTVGASPVERDGVPGGLHFLRVHAEGRESLRRAIEVRSGEETILQESLRPRPEVDLVARIRAALEAEEPPVPPAGVERETRPEALARFLAEVAGVDGVVLAQLARTRVRSEPAWTLAVVRAPAREPELARAAAVLGVVLAEERAEGVARLVARRLRAFLASGEAPPGPPADLGLAFAGHLLGRPQAGLPEPGPADAGPRRVAVEVFPIEPSPAPPPPPPEEPLWTRWWLWTAVGAVVLGGLALGLALGLSPEVRTIQDPDTVHIQVQVLRP